MGNSGRKSNWNKDAGNRLKVALDILAKNSRIESAKICEHQGWFLITGLPKHPRTVDKWLKAGIPEEADKIAKVAEFLRIPVTAFLESTETEFVEALKVAWGISKPPDARILPTCAQSNCICDNSTKAAQCISEIGEKWRDADMPYSLVMKYGQSTFHHLQDQEVINRVQNEAGRALGMLAAIHYSAGWEKWSSYNLSSPLAIEALLRTFRLPYWRVRFRVIYVLQYVDIALLKQLFSEHEKYLGTETLAAIRDHVFSKRVVCYLRYVAETSSDHDIRRKAMQVLSEIAALWKDESVGIAQPL